MKHYIKNIEISPRNIFDIGITCDFEAKIDQNKLTTDTLILANEAKSIVMNHLSEVGVFEGLPYEIKLSNNVKLDCYIDFTDGFKVKDTEIECKIKQRNGHDNFFDNAAGLTFEYLYSSEGGNIGSLYSRQVAYLVIPTDAVAQGLTCSLAIFTISMTIADQSRQLAMGIKDFTIIAIGVGFSRALVEATINVAIQLVFLSILLIQASRLIATLINLNVPTIKYFNCQSVLQLINQGCEYLGYTFDSTILNSPEYKNLSIIPVPLNNTDKKWYTLSQNNVNEPVQSFYPSASDTTATLGSLIDSMELMFNAKTRVINKVVTMERWDYWQSKSQNSITSSLVLQDSAKNEYSYDFSKLFKRYLISYQSDFSDYNTIDSFDNNNAEFSLERTNIEYEDLNLIKGLTNVNLPFASMTTKKSITWLEKEFIKLYKLIKKISKNSPNPDKNRIGLMIITNPYFTTSKLFIHDDSGNMPLPDTTIQLKPAYLWQNYHYINNPNTYQYLIKENVKIPMSSKLFKQLLNLNYIEIDNQPCEIMKLEYYDEKAYAIISYKTPNVNFKNNIELKKVF